MTKNILCFGDSNTWGYIPENGLRFNRQQRWTGLLQHFLNDQRLNDQRLNDQYHVIEEAINGRTTAYEDQHRPFRNGLAVLPGFLECHAPLDLVVIMLGTNDLKQFFALSVVDIASSVKTLCQRVLDFDYPVGPTPQVLLVSPSHIGLLPQEEQVLYIQPQHKSQQFASHYQKVAQQLNIHFLDAATIVQTSPIDGVHWSLTAHQQFAQMMAQTVKRILQIDRLG